MKKTLIALLALAGMACGATTEPTPNTGAALSSWLDVVAAEVTDGKQYTLTFVIGDTWQTDSGNIFSINNNWHIYQQAGQYVGLSEGSSSPSGNYTSLNTTTNITIDMDTAGAGETSDYSGWVYDTGVYGDGLDGMTFTIHSSSARGTVITLESGSITIELQRNGHTGITNLDFSNADLPIASASVESDGTTWTYTPPVTPGVPEPATATLSLLALAGLAARRRRRG